MNDNHMHDKKYCFAVLDQSDLYTKITARTRKYLAFLTYLTRRNDFKTSSRKRHRFRNSCSLSTPWMYRKLLYCCLL